MVSSRIPPPGRAVGRGWPGPSAVIVRAISARQPAIRLLPVTKTSARTGRPPAVRTAILLS